MAIVEITCWYSIWCGGCNVRLMSKLPHDPREQPLSFICACGHHQLFQEEDWRPEHETFIPIPREGPSWLPS